MLVQHSSPESLARRQRMTEPVALVVVVHMNAGVDGSSNETAVQHLVDEIKDRFAGVETDQRWLVLGDLVLDREARAVTRGSRHIHLAPLEYALLEYLALHPERVFSEDHLMNAIFGGARDGKRYNTLWVHLHRLRKKVDGDAPIRLIHTIRGAGYMLRAPLVPAIEAHAVSS
jgi:DNA-binding response OmpR family regulator